jgi:hypothetical protein
MSLVLRSGCGLIGLLFMILGVRWMFAPEAIAAESGLELLNPLGYNTARGDIGGLFIGGALLVALGLIREKADWLRVMAVVVACVATGRAIGLVIDGFARTSFVPFALELVIIAVLIATARDLENPADPEAD